MQEKMHQEVLLTTCGPDGGEMGSFEDERPAVTRPEGISFARDRRWAGSRASEAHLAHPGMERMQRARMAGLFLGACMAAQRRWTADVKVEVQVQVIGDGGVNRRAGCG